MTEINRIQAFRYLDGVADGLNESRKDIIAELEDIKAEIEAVELSTPIMSKGYECCGYRPKTVEEMRTEILDIISERIKENKQ